MKLRTLRSMALALAASVSLSACVYPYADNGYGDEGYADGYGYEDGYGGDGYGDGSAYAVAYGGRYGWDSYCDPFYDRYYYADCDYYHGFGQIGWGGGYWSNYYYPGYGLWIFDRGGRRHRMDDNHRRYWGSKRHEFRNGRGDYRNDNYWSGLGQGERDQRRGEWMRRRDAGQQPDFGHDRARNDARHDGSRDVGRDGAGRHLDGRHDSARDIGRDVGRDVGGDAGRGVGRNDGRGVGRAPQPGGRMDGRRRDRTIGGQQTRPIPGQNLPELGARAPQRQRPDVVDDGTAAAASTESGVNVVRQRPSMRRPRYEAEADGTAEQGRATGWRREQPAAATPAPSSGESPMRNLRRGPGGNPSLGAGRDAGRDPEAVSPDRGVGEVPMRRGPRFDGARSDGQRFDGAARAPRPAPQADPQASPQATPIRMREPVMRDAPAPQQPQAAPQAAPQPRPAPAFRAESPRREVISPRRETEGEP